MENSTPCKIVTPENFILKVGTRDYVQNITHYTNCYVLSFFSRSHAQLEPRDRFARFMAQMTWFSPRTVLLGVRQ